MDLGIKGKIALVGASGQGLGLSCAKRLAMEGCRIALCDINARALETAQEAICTAVPDATTAQFVVDFADAKAIDTMMAAVNKTLGPVDILVTNSGGPPPGTFDLATDAKWYRAFDLTFMSAVRLIRLVLPHMKTNGWGRIVNLTSRTLREPIANLMISNAVRLAVAGMAKTLAGEIAHTGVTVNNVGPGPTATDRAIELAGARAVQKGIDMDTEIALTNQRIPRGRMAEPGEIADMVAFLVSDLAGHITGQGIVIDGGETRAL